jgi:hypothetical protein
MSSFCRNISSSYVEPHLQLVHSSPEIPGPFEQLSDGDEGTVLAERAHAEDLRFGDLLDAPDAVFVHQHFDDFSGLTFEAAQEVLVAVEEGFGPLVAAYQGRVEGQVGQQASS